MKYLAAYCLLSLGGNESPSEDDLRNFFKKIDSEVNEEQLKAVVSHLKGKKLHELCTEGASQLGSLAVGTGGGQGGEEKKEEAEEEKEESEEESEDLDMGGLFD